MQPKTNSIDSINWWMKIAPRLKSALPGPSPPVVFLIPYACIILKRNYSSGLPLPALWNLMSEPDSILEWDELALVDFDYWSE